MQQVPIGRMVMKGLMAAALLSAAVTMAGGAGAQDLNAPASSSRTATPGSPSSSQSSTVPQRQDGQSATSGAIPPGATNGAIPNNRGEVNASSGGSAITGATGRSIPECMAAWDKTTHITKPRWREICARTLTEPHL